MVSLERSRGGELNAAIHFQIALFLSSYSRLKFNTDYSKLKCGFLKSVRNRQTMVSLERSPGGELNAAILFQIALFCCRVIPVIR